MGPPRPDGMIIRLGKFVSIRTSDKWAFPARTSTIPLPPGKPKIFGRPGCWVSRSINSALTLLSEAKDRARLIALKVFPSPGRALVTMMSRFAPASSITLFCDHEAIKFRFTTRNSSTVRERSDEGMAIPKLASLPRSSTSCGPHGEKSGCAGDLRDEAGSLESCWRRSAAARSIKPIDPTIFKTHPLCEGPRSAQATFRKPISGEKRLRRPRPTASLRGAAQCPG